MEENDRTYSSRRDGHAGWVQVMVPMIVEILGDLKTGEKEDDLRAMVEEFVGRLTGRQTISRMLELASHVELHPRRFAPCYSRQKGVGHAESKPRLASPGRKRPGTGA